MNTANEYAEMPPSDILMQSILDRLSTMDERQSTLIEAVHDIRENQIKIEGRLDSHIASTNSLSGAGTQSQNMLISVLGWVGKAIMPAILAVFLAFSCTAPSNKTDKQSQQPTIDTLYFDRTRAGDALKKIAGGDK